MHAAPRGGLLQRLSHRRADESGNALVISIAAVLMIGLLMGVIFSSVMFSVGSVSANRAKAAAAAAAEGGAQQVARKLLQDSDAETTACTGIEPPPGAWVNYEVLGVWFQNVEGGPWERCDNGGRDIPKMANAVKVKTTGYSESAADLDGAKGTRGLQGNKRGDEATVEMAFVRPSRLGLDAAIFGDLSLSAQTQFDVKPDANGLETQPVDVVTNKKWDCPSSGTVRGSVYALGGASIQSACKVDGDLYVRGQLDVGGKIEASGNLYVDGNLKSTANTIVGGDALVRGNVHLESTGHRFGNLRAYGSFSTTNTQSSALVAGGLYFTEATGDQHQLTTTKAALGGKWREITVAQRDQWIVAEPEIWALPSIMDTPENPRTDDDDERLEFPFLTREDPVFDTFSAGDWDLLTRGKRSSSSSACSANGFSTPVEIDSPTFVDVTGCPGGLWKQQDLKLKLNADLVIYGKNIQKQGTWQVQSGNAPGDTTRHTLYLISAPADNQTSCSPASGSKVTFTGSGWSQEDPSGAINTKVLIYSAGNVTFNNRNTNPLLGQIYGCTVLFEAGVNLQFARAGQDLKETLWDLRTGSVRDITDEPRS